MVPRCAHTHSPVPSGAAPEARLAHTSPGPQRAPAGPPQLAPSAPKQRAQHPHSSRAGIPGAGQCTGAGQRSGRHGPHSRRRLPAPRSPRPGASGGSNRSSSGKSTGERGMVSFGTAATPLLRAPLCARGAATPPAPRPLIGRACTAGRPRRLPCRGPARRGGLPAAPVPSWSDIPETSFPRKLRRSRGAGLARARYGRTNILCTVSREKAGSRSHYVP